MISVPSFDQKLLVLARINNRPSQDAMTEIGLHIYVNFCVLTEQCEEFRRHRLQHSTVAM